MENATRNKNQKSALRAIEKSFLKRKDCIKKKTMELSVLCDVKVCAIIVGPDGTVETWPESRNDVKRVIEMYRNCPVDKRKRQRPQELDHGGDDRSNKKRKVCVVSEGVKKTGFTEKDLLRRIDAKLCQVRKRIQLLKSNDQNTVDCTIDNPIETSFFQETASFDQNQIIDNSHWVATQLEEIHGFDETDLFDWSDLFNTGSENPHLMVVGKEDSHELLTTAPTPKSLDPCTGLTDTSQDFQSSTLGVNSFTPVNELMDTVPMAYNEELNQFTPTVLNSFSPRSESVNSFTLPGNLDFQNCSFFTPSETKHYGLYQNTPDCTTDNSIETSFFQETASFDQSQIIENTHWVDTQLEEIHEFEETDLFDWSDLFNTGSENPHLMVVGSHELLTTAPTPKSLDPCSGLTDTYQDFQSSTLGVNSLTPGNELMDTFSMAYNEELNQFTPTDLSSFSPTSESVNSFTLPDNLNFQRFTPNWNSFEDGAILDDLTSWHAVANNLWT